MATYTIELPTHTARLNQLMGNRWACAKLKKRDRELIATACMVFGVLPAAGKRRVSIHVILAPRQRGADPDAFWKSLLDAAKHARAIRDDNRQWCEHGPVTYSRGEKAGMVVTLQDLED